MLVLGVGSVSGQAAYESVGVKEFSSLVEEPGVVVLDVRTEREYAAGHLVGAVFLDQSEVGFERRAESVLPKGRTVAVYCRSGRRSASAAARLSALGYRCVNLEGGIVAWEKSGCEVTRDVHEVDVFRTRSGKTVRFYALMHASIRIEYDGREIEIDPVSKLGERVTDYASMPKADYILVTHEHGDHFDKGAIGLLAGEGTRVVTNARCAKMLGRGELMCNGDRLVLADDISVEAVPSYNTTAGREKFHPKGRDNGYVLTIDGLRVYVAGDTEDIEEMSELGDIDVAFLPCNQPYTMTVEQLSRAAGVVRPKVLFPYHYGQTDVSGVPSRLVGSGVEVRIRHYE